MGKYNGRLYPSRRRGGGFITDGVKTIGRLLKNSAAKAAPRIIRSAGKALIKGRIKNPALNAAANHLVSMGANKVGGVLGAPARKKKKKKAAVRKTTTQVGRKAAAKRKNQKGGSNLKRQKGRTKRTRIFDGVFFD